jgi:hypothetical protein
MVVKEGALLVKVGVLLQILVEGEAPMHHQEEEEDATDLMLNIRELQLETKAGQPQEDV